MGVAVIRCKDTMERFFEPMKRRWHLYGNTDIERSQDMKNHNGNLMELIIPYRPLRTETRAAKRLAFKVIALLKIRIEGAKYSVCGRLLTDSNPKSRGKQAIVLRFFVPDLTFAPWFWLFWDIRTLVVKIYPTPTVRMRIDGKERTCLYDGEGSATPLREC